MGKRSITTQIKKFIRSTVLCMFGCMALTGCQIIQQPVQKLVHGKMYDVTTSCKVLSIEGSIGPSHYLCKNGSDIYVYNQDAICNYRTGEVMVPIENRFRMEYMACSDDMLYYSVNKNNGQLYCYNLNTGENRMVTEDYEITGMRGWEDDVFVSVKEKESEPDYSDDKKEKNEVLYYHKTEDGISLTQYLLSQEPQAVTKDYHHYLFEGYQLIVDDTIEDDYPRVVYIGKENGFAYSCYGYALHGSSTYNLMEGEVIALSADVKCRYRGVEEELTTITENAKSGYAGLSTPFISFQRDRIGIIEQYGKGTPQYQENPAPYYKYSDAFFEWIPESGECQMLYEIQDGEQIAGYSYTKNCLYLLTNDGVYEYDLTTKKRKCVFTNEEAYECLCFEYMDDQLYIFRNSFVDQEAGVKLLSVVK